VVANRGPEAATVHVLPTLWFRNTWYDGGARPELRPAPGPPGATVIAAEHVELGPRWLTCEDAPALLFTDNDTNTERIFGRPNARPWVKDAIDAYVVHGRQDAVNPDATGTKAAAHYVLTVPARGERVLHLRLGPTAPTVAPGGAAFDAILARRRTEADAFYAALTPPSLGADGALVMRQAFAGMLWSKQYYYFDVERWLAEHGVRGTGGARRNARNRDWFHMLNDDVISMPDKWEYPWYAAWDLAFHTLPLAAVDLDFAKAQLTLMLREFYLHPNGQMPAYEWNFGDVNPPVHAWATLFMYRTEEQTRGRGDVEFLRHAFHHLLLNFTWWVNRKDPSGRNVFEGGFLGLDNVGVFDRSAPLPTGGCLEQADGTAWMALFSQNMLEMALELARHDPAYEDFAGKFLEHFLRIAAAMDRLGEQGDEMWDEDDGFYYDLLRLPNGTGIRLKVRSIVGLLPLCATSIFPADTAERFPRFLDRARRFLARHPELTRTIAPIDRLGVGGRRLLGILDERKLRRILARMLDEKEFLSPHGIRSLSRWHLEHPYEFVVHGETLRVDYQPAESQSGLFGGNSNWRGPVWMPVNVLILRALLQLFEFYGTELTVECPTGSGRQMNLFEVTQELARRLASIFLRGPDGRRPVFGAAAKFQDDPHWRDHVLFYEYFHGDVGAGIGASHQTGWTGVIGRLLQLLGRLQGSAVLAADAASPVLSAEYAAERRRP
jgi:hypothetical protein